MRISWVLLFSVCSYGFAQKTEKSLKPCESVAFRPVHLGLRHIEHQGIGYQTGYTTIQAFAIPSDPSFSWYPYLDARFHVFNDGYKALNAGLGLRCPKERDRIWGINAYYDFRSTRKKDFNQIAFGFESIGRRWDFFANGYIVAGSSKGSRYKTRFNHFSGYEAYLKADIDYAMSGGDAKIRYHFVEKPGYDFFFDIGPYFYRNKESAIGAQAKLGAKLADYVYLEANTSYDSLFKWIGQGVLGLSIPLGRQVPRKAGSTQHCHDAVVMRERLIQSPATQEIIVVDQRQESFPAINPETGQPYSFVFVNNLFGSQGTYEDPYGYLADAQTHSAPHDIIYVMQGDGTSNKMTAGITLKDYQQLLGSGTTQTLSTPQGNIEIPQQTAEMPLIKNVDSSGVALGDVVTLATHNTVSGMAIIAGSSTLPYQGIAAPTTGTSDVKILNNFIQINGVDLSNPRTFAINLVKPLSGQSAIENNHIQSNVTGSTDLGGGIGITPIDSSVSVVHIGNNTYNGRGYGIYVVPFGSSEITLNISGNALTCTKIAASGDSGYKQAIWLEPHGSSKLYYTVTDNSVSGENGIHIIARDTSSLRGSIANNYIYDCPNGMQLSCNGEKHIASCNYNKFTRNRERDFWVKNEGPGSMCLSAVGNYAPQHGFVVAGKANPYHPVNISSFTGNVGPTSFSNVTYNPVCP